MKMKQLIAALALSVPLLTACSSTQSTLDTDDAIENGGAYRAEIAGDNETSAEDVVLAGEGTEDNKSTEESKTEISNKSDVKIISTLHMEAESINFDEDVENLESEIHGLEGYIRSHEIVTNDINGIYKEASISIRVPKDYVNELSDFIKETFSITSEQSQAIDITEDYYDTESRIENLSSQEEQLGELYENANSIEDMLLINGKLSEVTREKEEMTKKIMRMNERSSYSTIELNIIEVKDFTISESVNESIGQRISNAFNQSITKTKNASAAALVFIANSFQYIVLGLLLIPLYNKFLKKHIIKFTDKDNNDESEDDTDK